MDSNACMRDEKSRDKSNREKKMKMIDILEVLTTGR